MISINNKLHPVYLILWEWSTRIVINQNFLLSKNYTSYMIDVINICILHNVHHDQDFREDSSEEIDRLFFKRHYLARKDQSIVLFLEYWKHFAFNSFLGEFLWDRASGYNRHLTL